MEHELFGDSSDVEEDSSDESVSEERPPAAAAQYAPQQASFLLSFNQ